MTQLISPLTTITRTQKTYRPILHTGLGAPQTEIKSPFTPSLATTTDFFERHPSPSGLQFAGNYRRLQKGARAQKIHLAQSKPLTSQQKAQEWETVLAPYAARIFPDPKQLLLPYSTLPPLSQDKTQRDLQIGHTKFFIEAYLLNPARHSENHHLDPKAWEMSARNIWLVLNSQRGLLDDLESTLFEDHKETPDILRLLSKLPPDLRPNLETRKAHTWTTHYGGEEQRKSTPLTYAILHQRGENVKLLIALGAPVDAVDLITVRNRHGIIRESRQESALDIAIHHQDLISLQALLEANVTISEQARSKLGSWLKHAALQLAADTEPAEVPADAEDTPFFFEGTEESKIQKQKRIRQNEETLKLFAKHHLDLDELTLAQDLENQGQEMRLSGRQTSAVHRRQLEAVFQLECKEARQTFVPYQKQAAQDQAKMLWKRRKIPTHELLELENQKRQKRKDRHEERNQDKATP